VSMLVSSPRQFSGGSVSNPHVWCRGGRRSCASRPSPAAHADELVNDVLNARSAGLKTGTVLVSDSRAMGDR